VKVKVTKRKISQVFRPEKKVSCKERQMKLEIWKQGDGALCYRPLGREMKAEDVDEIHLL
jgi:hypothetical protein